MSNAPSITTAARRARPGPLAACAGAPGAGRARRPPRRRRAGRLPAAAPPRPLPGASPAARQFAASLGAASTSATCWTRPPRAPGRCASTTATSRWSVRRPAADIAQRAPARALEQPRRAPTRRPRIDPAFMARVDDVVRRLLARGVPVVLDMHHYRQLDGDALDAGETPVPDAVVERRFLAHVAADRRALPRRARRRSRSSCTTSRTAA